MKRPYPSLSTRGWIEDAPSIIDAVTANFFLTHPSLTVEYNDAVYALPALIQQYGNNDIDIQKEMRDAFTALFSRYFDNVVVETTVTYPYPDDATRMNVTLYATVEQNNVSYNLAQQILLENGKVVKIAGINNGG